MADGGSKPFYVIRHGATALNRESGNGPDRIRGHRDIPLSPTGVKEAEKLAGQLKGSGIKVLFHSGMLRTKKTADIIARKIGAEVKAMPALKPWNVGIFTGKESKEAVPELIVYAKKRPGERVPEGESFNEFRRRAMMGILMAVEQMDGRLGAIVTHHRVERLLKSWMAAGEKPSLELDMAEMFSHGEKPGTAEKVSPNLAKLRQSKVLKARPSPMMEG